MIKCKTQRELWDLEDYEAIAPKIEHKPVTKPEYRSLGMEPFLPIDNKKQISKVLVTTQFNKGKFWSLFFKLNLQGQYYLSTRKKNKRKY